VNSVLFDFDSQAEFSSWTPINDVVMGGVSHSTFEYIGASTATFSGIVSLENSGGFASVRSSSTSLYDLRRYSGVLLRVRGDGKQYKLNLKTEATFDGVQYQALFQSPNGEWTEIRIAFSEFVPMFRGAPARQATQLDKASICSFGFLISGKQEGLFRLDIDRIGVYEDL
jgi:NADH dehydrogenase [ubiquinone] 1 alpha subcomplex assembly factor 1